MHIHIYTYIYIQIHTYTDLKLGWEAKKLTDSDDGVPIFLQIEGQFESELHPLAVGVTVGRLAASGSDSEVALPGPAGPEYLTQRQL
jgi:hypothetical protein